MSWVRKTSGTILVLLGVLGIIFAMFWAGEATVSEESASSFWGTLLSTWWVLPLVAALHVPFTRKWGRILLQSFFLSMVVWYLLPLTENTVLHEEYIAVLTLSTLLVVILIGGAFLRSRMYEQQEMFGVRWWRGDTPLPTIRTFELLQNLAAVAVVILLGMTGLPVLREVLEGGAWWPLLVLLLFAIFFWYLRKDVPTAGWLGLLGSAGLLLWGIVVFFFGAFLW